MKILDGQIVDDHAALKFNEKVNQALKLNFWKFPFADDLFSKDGKTKLLTEQMWTDEYCLVSEKLEIGLQKIHGQIDD
jgi:hypothetical protein